MPLPCTHTTVPTGYPLPVTAAPRSVRARDPFGSRPGLPTDGSDRDVAAEADYAVELQLLGQQLIQFLIAEAAVSHDADTDAGGQHLGKTPQDLILVAVAPIFQRRLVNRQPHQRRRPAMPGDQRQHDRRLVVGIEIGPIHRDRDAGPLRKYIKYPLGEQRAHHDPLVRQHAVDLLDRMLGQKPAGHCQTLADQGHRE